MWLTSTAPTHVATHSLRTSSVVTGVQPRAAPADGLVAASATLSASVAVANTGAADAAGLVVTCTLVEAGVTASVTVDVAAGATANVSCPPLAVANAELWSLPRPYLHTLAVGVATPGGAQVDAMNTSVGLRTVAWDADTGLQINSQPVKMRGVCNHESFAGVGAAVPDRIDL